MPQAFKAERERKGSVEAERDNWLNDSVAADS